MNNIDYSKIEDVEIEDLNFDDSPDFCDAYIARATYEGKEMSEDQLDKLNEDSDFVYEKILDHIH